MDDKLKQRLIGAVIIIAIAVVFVPMLFNGSSSGIYGDDSQISQLPDFSLNDGLPSPDELDKIAWSDDPTIATIDHEPPIIPEPQKVLSATNASQQVTTENKSVISPQVLAKNQEDTIIIDSKVRNNNKESLVTAVASNENVSDSQKSAAENKKVVPRSNISTAAAVKKTLEVNKPGWSVRLATFSNKDNATSLQQKLNENGYNAYLKPIKANGRDLTMVYVGPELQKANATKLANELERNYKLKGMVVSYKPSS